MPSPALTRSRIAALAGVAVIALCLAWIAVAGKDQVSVPDHAKAGQLTTESCTYDGFAADCGTLVVPENRRNPDSRLIALPVTRIHARSERPGAPIFRLEGGPGITNMQFDRARPDARTARGCA